MINQKKKKRPSEKAQIQQVKGKTRRAKEYTECARPQGGFQGWRAKITEENGLKAISPKVRPVSKATE